MTINPSAGAGLAACSLAEYEEESAIVEARGWVSERIEAWGRLKSRTPSLAEKATGSVYLAQPYANLTQFAEPGHPGGSLLALYVVARFPVDGVLVKVAGRVQANPVTGRLRRRSLKASLRWVVCRGLGGLPPVPFDDVHVQVSSRVPPLRWSARRCAGPTRRASALSAVV